MKKVKLLLVSLMLSGCATQLASAPSNSQVELSDSIIDNSVSSNLDSSYNSYTLKIDSTSLATLPYIEFEGITVNNDYNESELVFNSNAKIKSNKIREINKIIICCPSDYKNLIVYNDYEARGKSLEETITNENNKYLFEYDLEASNEFFIKNISEYKTRIYYLEIMYSGLLIGGNNNSSSSSKDENNSSSSDNISSSESSSTNDYISSSESSSTSDYISSSESSSTNDCISSSESSSTSDYISSSESSSTSDYISSSESSSTNDNISSSESSSTNSDIYIPSMKESVSHISDNYTIAYTIKEGNEERDYRNELEKLNLSGAEGNVVYFSEYSESGYYFTENGSYYIYNDGYGQPIYTTNGALTNEEITLLESFLDINANFSNAEWELGEYDATTFTYYTRDEAVIATADFLTDYYFTEEIDYVMATIEKKGKNYRTVSFTIFNTGGDVLTNALIQRVGGTMALDVTPVLNDNLDETLKTKWIITTGYGNDIGKLSDYFEVTSDNKLIVYNLGQDNLYSKNPTEYIFKAPEGDGSYLFADSSNNFVTLQYYQGDVLLRTAAAGATEFKVDLCMEYYTYWFMAAADYFGYYVEPMAKDDDYYDSAVTQFGAVRAYYAAKMEYDETTGAEYATELVIVSQFLNQDALIAEFFEGDVTMFNGYVLGGVIFGNMIGAMATECGMDIMYNIASILSPEYAPIDFEKYTSLATPEAGQSASEYLVEYMTAAGYSYMDKASSAAQPDYSINTNPAYETSGINFNDTITRLLADDSFGHSTDVDGNTIFKGTDMYIFYKANPDEDTNEYGDEYLYAAVIITDRIVDDRINFYGDVYLVAMGYFIVSGEIYGALQTWQNAQTPSVNPRISPLKFIL